MFSKKLKGDVHRAFEEYTNEEKDTNYLFWQRDPLVILITDKIVGRKLDYMHTNPLQPHQQLCKEQQNIGFHQRSFMKQEKMNLNTYSFNG